MSRQFHLSVIIPNLNRSHSLVRAVQSIWGDNKAAEIIVVDDASDVDLSAEYACLQDMGVRIFRQPVRKRGGAARNRGVREASGTHVSFLDSDDVWMPGRHERVRQFYSTPESAQTVLLSGVLLHVDNETRQPYQPPWRPGSSVVEYVYRDMGRVQTSMLNMPLDIARGCPWDEALQVNQDTDLVMRMDQAGIAFHIDTQPGVIKEESIHPGRLTTWRETADLSYEWYRRVSKDWSPAARSGYHLQDRVWRLQEAGRRREAFGALLRSLAPPVSLRETARRALSMMAGPWIYIQMRKRYRSTVQVPVKVDAVQQWASEIWYTLDERAQRFCAEARAGYGRQDHASIRSDG